MKRVSAAFFVCFFPAAVPCGDRYYGTVSDGESEYLVLEDITAGMRRPCVMDIKVTVALRQHVIMVMGTIASVHYDVITTGPLLCRYHRMPTMTSSKKTHSPRYDVITAGQIYDVITGGQRYDVITADPCMQPQITTRVTTKSSRIHVINCCIISTFDAYTVVLPVPLFRLLSQIGTKSSDEDASPEKAAREASKWPLQSVLGFRLSGWMLHTRAQVRADRVWFRVRVRVRARVWVRFQARARVRVRVRVSV